MKYIHKQLGREANYFQTEYVEGYKISCNGLLVFGDNWITADKLLALGFEPVKEEVPEWIDVAYNEYIKNINEEGTGESILRKAIEKHMPKQEQQKITVSEVLSLMSGCVALPADMCIKYRLHEFLKSKGLLKE